MENNWKVIITKSDVEPWWFFENWEEDIEKQWTCPTKEEAVEKFIEELKICKEKYPSIKHKNFTTVAFWNPEEIEFCVACDDDLQIYHGLILMENEKPLLIEGENSLLLEIQKLLKG
ncbi:DUF1033 family protein [Bacillus seohaeanensis]|jgi:hypothetical protein|uniref:DUF1033 family protein n=1 Tax=Bacillus seohaeanensis TaxID=284580 RepID=A0ABW5RTS9_9BACI